MFYLLYLANYKKNDFLLGIFLIIMFAWKFVTKPFLQPNIDVFPTVLANYKTKKNNIFKIFYMYKYSLSV